MKNYFIIGCIYLLPQPFSHAQNLGIGINIPTRAKLELNGAVGNTAAIFGGESTGISLQRTFPAIGFNQYNSGGWKYIANGYAAAQFLDPFSGGFYLDLFPSGLANANAAQVQRAFSIGTTGNLAIKTNSINASLYAIKAGNPDGSVQFGGNAFVSAFHYGTNEDTYIRGGYSGSFVFLNDIPFGNVILGSGNTRVGINSGNPTYTLEILQANDKGLLLVDPTNNFYTWEQRVLYGAWAPNSLLGFINNGDFVFGISPLNGDFVGISDERLKKNIKPLSPVLDKISQFRPSIYEMKDNNPNHEKTYGFIAQEVKPIFSNLVRVSHIETDSLNHIADLHGVYYNGFGAVAIKALQEQYQQIKELEKENDSLMKRLEILDKKIAAKVSGTK